MTIFNTVLVIIFTKYWQETNLPSLSLLTPEGKTKIYDKDNNLIVTLDSKFIGYTSYNEIPNVMIDSVTAIEDSRFFTHNGLDYYGLIRAIINNLKAGGIKEGASTITQQLIKNVYLSNEKSIERKIKEAILALKLEHVLKKEDIIASYLSNVLFGGNVYGIKMASKYYFDKDVKDINLLEASTLAAIIQMPNYYNPFINPVACENRRNAVLKRMYELDLISYDEYSSSLDVKVQDYLKKGEINENLGIYAQLIDYLSRESSELYEKNIYSNNFDIYTKIDSNISLEIYKILRNEYNTFPKDEIECGIVVLDTKTANIVAIGGSRVDGFKNLNYATDVYNQPGSTIKPILDYAPAFEYLGYQPLTQIDDSYMKYSTGEAVKNWDNQYKGLISLRYALSNSRNIPAIKLYQKLGNKAWKFAEGLGIYNKDPYLHESMAIGGFQNGYSVLEMTNAYLGFANDGLYIKAHLIDKIKSYDETISKNPYQKQAMSKEVAFFINSILLDVLKNSAYNPHKTELAAKTGQSNFDLNTRKKYDIPNNATKDSWVIGYTKEYVIGIWVGFGTIKKGNYLDSKTKNIPLKILSQLIDKFTTKYQKFDVPSNVVYKNAIIYNGKLYEASNGDFNYKSDYFSKGYILPPFDDDTKI